MSRASPQVYDHLQIPRNPGRLENPTVEGCASIDGKAPRLTLYIQLSLDRVHRMTFEWFGCGFAIASCSVRTELATGLSIRECRIFTANHVIEALGGMPPDKQFCAELAAAALSDVLNQIHLQNP